MALRHQELGIITGRLARFAATTFPEFANPVDVHAHPSGRSGNPCFRGGAVSAETSTSRFIRSSPSRSLIRASRSAPGLCRLVDCPPVAREFAGDGGLQEGAAEEGEALARLRQRRLALRDLGEQRVDPLDDAALLRERRQWKKCITEEVYWHSELPC